MQVSLLADSIGEGNCGLALVFICNNSSDMTFIQPCNWKTFPGRAIPACTGTLEGQKPYFTL